MRKIAVCAMALAVVTLFGACKKEGVYNPSKKISKIYESYSEGDFSTGKQLSEVWKWDGDLLTQIDYYDTFEDTSFFDGTMTFTYDDDNRLIQSTSDFGERIVYEYDDNTLAAAYIYYSYMDYKDATWNTKMEFTHDGKKITKIVMTGDFDLFKKSSKKKVLAQLLLRPVLNNFYAVDKCMQVMDKADLGKAQQTVTLNLTWDGKNVSGVSMVPGMLPVSFSMQFSYDNKRNPFYGFLYASLIGDGNMGFEFANRNNVTKAVENMSFLGESVDGTTDFTYTYDGKWPVTCEYDETEEYDDEVSVIHRTVYYEYL